MRNSTRLFVIIMLAAAGMLEVSAQQLPQLTMNMLDKYNLNPAYGGMDASLSATGVIKSQWEELAGAPKTQYITAHVPLYIANGGVGVKFYHDAIGTQESLGFQASFNYVMETNLGLFSVGLAAGVLQQKLDGSLLRTPDGFYEGPTILHNDPTLANVTGTGLGPTASLGAYFANDFLEVGIAVDQMLGNTITLNTEEETSLTLQRSFNAFVEYAYHFSEEISLYPSVFAKTDAIQTQLDLAARVEFQDLYFGGLVFRGYSANTIDALAIFGGARINNNLRVSYAYDITLSALASYSGGTHEFTVQYNLNKPVGIGRPERVIYNPRY